LRRKETAGGVGRRFDPRSSIRPGRPALEVGTSRFKDPHHPVRPYGRKSPFFGYNDV
jgi:hypothetical protein